MPRWARLITGVAAFRVAAALALYLSGQVDTATPTPMPAWAYAVISFSFGVVGAALVIANRNDVRAAWLGGVLLLIASPLAGRLLSPAYAPVYPWVGRVHPDAFLPAFLWRFLIEFPSPLKPPLRRAAAAMAIAGILVGLTAAAVNLSIALWPGAAIGDWRTILSATRRGILYWPAVFVPSAAAFGCLLARMANSTGADLFRLRVFVGGLAAGLLPLFVEVTVEEVWPRYKALVHQPTIEPWVGLVLFGPLATVPALVAYAVVFDRVVEMRLVVRAAFQYLLARVTIVGVTSVPFVALALYLVRHRTESLVNLLGGPRPLALVAAVVAGTVTLRARRRWLGALDRRFFREPYDTQQLLASVSDEFISCNPVEIANRLTVEIDRGLHARADLFVADESGGVLRDPRGHCPPLDVDATLVRLAMADVQPMDLNLGPGAPLERLPDAERAWIASGGYRLVVPLRAPTGEPAGLLALGEKRSELPFSASERRSLAALAAPIVLAVEYDRLRHSPEPVTEPSARECDVCSRLYPSDAVACTCGGVLADAPVPHVLRGVYRFDRRIGAGGMGVVYRALDLTLSRRVAIKTLPQVTPDHATRLRREAQAMAAIIHPNLAVIYGIETWRGVPFLVEEYLDGGTLADRLRAGPMAVEEALGLGIALAGVLEQLHGAGIVHCDIKPSNIGFSRGVVKLLDFGLAHLLRLSAQTTTSMTTTGYGGPVASAVTDRGVLGTPPYMSPEALHAASPSPSFDLWALSVVLYEAIGGRRPFVGSDVSEIAERIRAGMCPDLRTVRADCGEDVAEFFARALSIDVGLRPASAAMFRTSLCRLRTSTV